MQGQVAAVGRQLGDEVLVVPLGCAGDVLHCEIEVEKLGMSLGVGVLLQPVLQGGLKGMERLQQLGGQLLQKGRAALLGCLLPGLQKRFVGAGQGRFQGAFPLAEGALCLGQAAFAELCRVHGAGPVGQIVGFVDEEEPIPGGVEETVEPHHRVEEVIVIPDDHVAPRAEVEPQFEGADCELPGGFFQRGPAELRGPIQKGGQRVLDPIKIALCIGADLRQTGRVTVGVLAKARFLLGRQGHAAQGQLRG